MKGKNDLMFLKDFLRDRLSDIDEEVCDELGTYLTKREDVFHHSKKVSY